MKIVEGAALLGLFLLAERFLPRLRSRRRSLPSGNWKSLTIVMWLSVLSIAPSAANAAIPPAERQALVDLYNNTTGAGWTNKTNWLGAPGTECTWFGVTCDPGQTTVTGLALNDNNLVGGPLPPSLGNLAQLLILDLAPLVQGSPSRNRISGSIPVELGSLAQLQYLRLFGNQLTGSIPPELGRLAQLRQLLLYFNRLTGGIPPELGKLNQLGYLHLGSNQLTGRIPAELGSLTALTGLYLGSNQLSGNVVPGLKNLSRLKNLDLGFNALFSTDAALTAFLTSVQNDGNWLGKQTIAPVISTQAGTTTSIPLNWSPILYTGDDGFYQAFYSMTSGGPYTPFPTTTASKSSSSLTVTGLAPNTRYYFVVSTTTLAHLNFPDANRNKVVSDLSSEAVGTTGATAIVVASTPAPLVEVAGSGSTATSSYVLTNVGGLTTTITLGKGDDQGGNFFSQSPSQPFSLDPGGSQIVTITSTAQALPILLKGVSIPTGAGVTPGLQIPVQLFAHAPPGLGIPSVFAVASRVDVAGPIGQDPTGQISFRNDGNATAYGVLSADVPWIVPTSGIIQIEPGTTSAPISFQIKRSQQPDAANPAGSITGTITLVYPTGSTGGNARNVLGSPVDPTSLAGLVVSDTRQKDVSNTPIPPLEPGEVALLVPGIGHVVGSGGKEFITDVSIVGTDSVVGVPDMKVFYTSSAPTAKLDQAVSPSQGLQLADVVTQSFKIPPPTQGTLHIRSKDTSKLAVSANVFNKANPKGSYGTAIPVFRSNRVIGSGEKLVLTGLRKDATAHTNLYLQEMSGSQGAAHIEFFNAAGQSLSTSDATVNAFSFTSQNNVVPDGGVMAVVTNTSGGKLQAYATPVDDASGDTWAVADWDRQYGLTGTEAMLIPVAGFLAGANGANFRTDIAVTNIGSTSETISLTYYPANVTKTITLGANQTSAIADVTETLFLVTGTSVGSIIATPQNAGRFAVTSRTYTAASGDPATYGTGVPTLPVSGALRSGQSQILGGIEDSTLKTQNAKAGNTFRTNVGLVETTGQPATVKLSIFFADGLNLSGGSANGTLNVTLAGHEFKQLNGIVRQVLGADRDTRYGDLHNVQVKVEVLSGSTGSVVPFITLTDNGTNDTVLRTE
ncbi:MAG TPA: hypothetical protein VHL58_14170 [Thermoanaerobaculia bacterium]|nr:hypothetical protein [Thermoanaerobaculia bacterium]